MSRTRFAQNDLARIAYAVSGDPANQCVVLLHDLLADRGTLNPLADALANTSLVIAPDARGHGASSATTDRTLSVTELANDVVAVLDTERVAGPVHMMGHGLGTAVALELAHWRPDRVASLSIIEPDAPSILDGAEEAAHRTARESARTAATAAADAAYKGLAGKALSAWLEPRWGSDWKTDLPRIRLAAMNRHVPALAPMLDAVQGFRLIPEHLAALDAPVLIVDAATSPAVVGPVADTLAGWLPAAQRRTVDALPLGRPFADNPQAVDVVTSFLESARGSSR